MVHTPRIMMLIVPVSVWEELVDMVILVSDLELDDETQNILDMPSHI